MKRIIRFCLLSLIFFGLLTVSVYAEKYKGAPSGKSVKANAAGCEEPASYQYLQYNNVRARINTGGDMWWDLVNGTIGRYYVPGSTQKSSMFSAALWIGGLDINNQLKLAALRYRANGTDYWTGPLTMDGTAATDEETCSKWDRFFISEKSDVEEFVGYWQSENKDVEYPGYTVPAYFAPDVYPWKGDVDKGQTAFLAPFHDENGDLTYDPADGDYPFYDLENDLCPLNFAGDPNYVPKTTQESSFYDDYYGGILVDQALKGDQTFWWVFNDKGNAHAETQGDPIGMEIHAQAFAFSTSDAINNMTFYTYEIINRSTYELTKTYFSPWADTDLGQADDDYIGCDVRRGLGYCYNGDNFDGSSGEVNAYGEQPPAVGVDFFQGPYMDPDGYDNPAYFGDGLLGPTIDNCEIVSHDNTEEPLTYGSDELGYTTETFLVKAEAINGVNFGNGIVDDERYGMKRFVYHNNGGFAYWTDPDIAPKYYNFLRGIWNDNTRMLYGGNGHASTGAEGPECNFMFPYDTDPCNWGTGGDIPGGGYNQNGLYWNEDAAGNNPDDRRFMQSAGPFTLKPGAVNYITVGIPWARAKAGGAWASVELLKIVDDKCQALFDNCFKVIDGPTAPDMTIRELNNKLIFYLTNSRSSNNFNENYLEKDPQIPKEIDPDGAGGNEPVVDADQYYHFEGYQIYQLKNADVSLSESIYDPDKVRLVAQFDIKNGIGRLINFNFDENIGADVPVIEVDGGDRGISHSFVVTEDLFASGDRALVNYKQYYYSAIAYAYNEYKPYTEDDSDFSDGQKTTYLAGRKNVKVVTAIPHHIVNGLVMNADFGDGPKITRIEGNGNGGMSLELTEESINELLSKDPGDSLNTYGSDNYPLLQNPTYQNGHGPVDIRVVDPLRIKPGAFTIKFDTIFEDFVVENITNDPNVSGDTASFSSTSWKLINNETNQVYSSEKTTNIANEQLFTDLGISISINSIFYPGRYKIGSVEGQSASVYRNLANNNGFIESSIEFSDETDLWLGGVRDADGAFFQDWIRSGTSGNDYASAENPIDPTEIYEKIVEGIWAPYRLTATINDNVEGPAATRDGNKFTRMDKLASVDIVFTTNKDNWTRCPVIEMCPDKVLSEGNADKFELRAHYSVNKEGEIATTEEGSDDPNDPNYISGLGMGWFPGYVINLETGERLNMMFGEDSHLTGHHGADMLFNPDTTLYNIAPDGSAIFGGKHYVYVIGSGITEYSLVSNVFDTVPSYDAGRKLMNLLNDGGYGPGLAMESAMYVGMPMLSASALGFQNGLDVDEIPIPSSDVAIKIRIAKPYERYFANDSFIMEEELDNKEYPVYSFTLDDLAPTYDLDEKIESDLDMVNVVPNPYYAYSAYEFIPLQNEVKITNLPETCEVTIYNMEGTMVRQFKKDDPVTYIAWDLKNHAGIPIAGGVYLIHIRDKTNDKTRERIIKWFGSLRVEDFRQF